MLATELIIERMKELSGFKSCVIVGQDGLALDSYIPDDTDKNFISAVISSMFSEINKQSNRINRKEPKTTVMETDQAILAITQMPIQGEPFIIFSEFSSTSNSIDIMDSVNKLSGSAFV